MVKLQKSTQMQAECVEKMHIPLRLQHHLPPKPPQIVLQSTKPNAIPCRHAHKKRRKICDIFPDILSQAQIPTMKKSRKQCCLRPYRSDPLGARTQDPHIKSVMLYLLS